MASNSPATSSSCGRRSAAVAGAGVASTTASASTDPPADATSHPPDDDRSRRSADDERRRSAPRVRRPAASASTSDAMPPSSDQKSGGPSGSGGGTSARRAFMRPPRRWAAASRGGKVAAADMSSTEPAWIPPIRGSTSMSTTRCPSLRATSGPMARSPIGPRTSGRGSTASRARPSAPRAPTMPDRAVGQNRVGMPRAWPSGNARRRPRAHTDAPRAPHGHQVVGDPHLPAQLDRLGSAAEEPVGAQVDHAPPDVHTLQGPAELRRRFQEGDRRRAGQRGRPTGQLPRCAQAADTAADDDHAAWRHLRVLHRWR